MIAPSEVDLVEYRSQRIGLDRVDAEFISSQLAKKFRITRPALGDGFDVNPQQHVGIIRLPSGMILRCQTKVPVANLMRMLAVALDLPELRPEHVPADEIDELLELTARHFAELVLRRVDAGLHREYVELSENRAIPRGRIDFVNHVRTNHVMKHRTYCRYSELTWDVPANQVIRQVVQLLSVQPAFSRKLRNELRSLDAAMDSVTPGQFSAADLSGFTYHRFNLDYEQIHRLCGLFLEGSSLSEDLGSFDGRAFLVDMNLLFERFVAATLRNRLGSSVATQVTTHLDRSRIVEIRPDIEISGTDARLRFVADTKYKRTASEEFRNSDVYQLLAYCVSEECSEGALIYPASEIGDLAGELVVRNSSIHLQQIGLDLSATGDAWTEALDRFVSAVATLARGARAA